MRARATVASATLGGDRARARSLLEAGLAHADSAVRTAATDALADWPENAEWVDEALRRLQWSETDRALAQTAHAARVRWAAKHSIPFPPAKEGAK